MNPERWRQIESLYHAALERDPEARPSFLEKACADEDLRFEVESLLGRSGGGLMDSTSTQLAAGAQLGPYKIEAPIGAGGMGQVFRARDTRLGRTVAIKITNEEFSGRFEREARAISALNHPNICTLHDVGPNYLVMELVEGETLAACLKKGALPVELVLRYGMQIADALSAAHSKGIIHRDLKPGNIMVTKSGIKVLDFGLAKSAQDETITASRAVMGTPAYMAPEQREGKACDARTDIFALGLVLYEMATGKRPAQGQPTTMGSVPLQLAPTIERCLASDPEDRWNSAKDLKAVLEWAGKSQPTAPVASRHKTPPWVWGAAVLACGGMLIAVVSQRKSPPSERPAQFTLSFAEQMAGAGDAMPKPSPDGRYFVFVGSGAEGGASLWIRPLDSAEAKPLPGTKGAATPFWSPDSRWIGFYSDGKLKKVSPSGGPPQTIADLPGLQDVAWGPGGDIIYRPSNRYPLYRIRDSGGSPTQLTHLDEKLTENSHRGPFFLPDGRRFLFTTRCGQRENNALYVGSLDSPKVKRLMPIESKASYLPPTSVGPGSLLYYRDGGLVARPFKADSEELAGEAVPVINRVAYAPGSIAAFFEISADGHVIVIRPADADETQLAWFDRNGEKTGTLGPRGDFGQPRISPNGDRVAFTQPDIRTGNRDLWYIEIARGVAARLTVHIANDWFPVWSPDGKQILFGSDRDGGTAMLPYLKKSMDSGSDERLWVQGVDDPQDWSRDGHWLAGGSSDIWISPASGDRKPFPYVATPFREGGARFSPDGKRLAYVSNETGRFEVYVRPFAGSSAAPEGKIQISNNGGDFPVWGPDGQELFYMGADFNLYVVNTKDLSNSRSIPLPTRLFRACPDGLPRGLPTRGASYSNAYDTHDGKHFLINCTTEPPGRFIVLMDWAAAP